MDNYDDIIKQPHPVSKKHPQMSMFNRAMLFHPFDAVKGRKESIDSSSTDYESKYFNGENLYDEEWDLAQLFNQ